MAHLEDMSSVKITVENIRSVILKRGISAAVCFIVSIFCLVFELGFLCLSRNNFVFHLFFYYTLVSILVTGGEALQIVRYFIYELPADKTFCEVLAFLQVYTGTVFLEYLYK